MEQERRIKLRKKRMNYDKSGQQIHALKQQTLRLVLRKSMRLSIEFGAKVFVCVKQKRGNCVMYCSEKNRHGFLMRCGNEENKLVLNNSHYKKLVLEEYQLMNHSVGNKNNKRFEHLENEDVSSENYEKEMNLKQVTQNKKLKNKNKKYESEPNYKLNNIQYKVHKIDPNDDIPIEILYMNGKNIPRKVIKQDTEMGKKESEKKLIQKEIHNDELLIKKIENNEESNNNILEEAKESNESNESNVIHKNSSNKKNMNSLNRALSNNIAKSTTISRLKTKNTKEFAKIIRKKNLKKDKEELSIEIDQNDKTETIERMDKDSEYNLSSKSSSKLKHKRNRSNSTEKNTIHNNQTLITNPFYSGYLPYPQMYFMPYLNNNDSMKTIIDKDDKAGVDQVMKSMLYSNPMQNMPNTGSNLSLYNPWSSMMPQMGNLDSSSSLSYLNKNKNEN